MEQLKNSQILSTEAEWLEARKECVTASEVAALLGLNPYSSGIKILKDKRNPTFKGNGYTLIGHWLEDVVVKASNLALGTLFSTPQGEGKVFCKCPQLALGATPDAWAFVPKMGGTRTNLLECKSTRPETFIRYRTTPPNTYLVQLITQMMCAEADEGYLAIMMTDLSQISDEFVNPLVIYRVYKSSEFDALIKQEVIRFWECVSKGKDFRADGKVRTACTNLLEDMVEKIYCVSDQSLELYFKNRVNIYNGIVDTIYNNQGNKSLEDILNG